MRRLPAVATFVLVLASVCVQAQHGGGHGSSGGHGSISSSSHGSMGGHVGSARAFSGMRSAPRMGASRGFSPNSSFRQRSFVGAGVRPGFRGNSVRLRTFNGRNCFGCRRGFIYPWAYGGYYDPYWWSDNGSSYDYEQEQQIGLANEMNQQNLAEQQSRREQEQNQDQDMYARQRSSNSGYSDLSPNPSPAMRGDVQAQSFASTTVLIFRDQHKQEVQNYAIVGDVLWAFSPQRQKIQLDDLDIPATQKANEDRGVDFRIPNDVQTSYGRISIGISYQ